MTGQSKEPFELKVVPLSPDGKPHVYNLHESLVQVIDDYLNQKGSPVTRAEIIGTLEFVKKEVMERE